MHQGKLVFAQLMLCLSVFAWAPFRSTKAAIKLHVLLDLRGNIPCFIHISDGKTHEVNARQLPFVAFSNVPKRVLACK